LNVIAAYTSREKIEVYRFSLPTAVLVPLGALFFQAFIPSRFHFFEVFDLPLLVTIFFSVARRNPISGLITGGIIGLLQDSLTHNPIGIYGIAKTVVGYGASSIGVKIDVENPGSRLLLTFAFYWVHQAVYFLVARGLVGQEWAWRGGHFVLAAIANALLALVLFAALDRFKLRA
jgi:rod shape-determining protein MreD